MRPEISQSMKKGQSIFNKSFCIYSSKGFLLVEVALASSILGLLVTAFVGAYLYGEESTLLAGNRAQATYLAQEGLEAVRNIRDADFSNLADGTYGISATDRWSLYGLNDTTDIFTREIEIYTHDDNYREITAIVSWQQNPQRTGIISISTLLTNWTAVVEPEE